MAFRADKICEAIASRRAVMALIGSFVASVIATMNFNCASASIRITADNGGPVGNYIKMFSQIRDSGESVIIDGNCLSACTLVLALIPQERICVTPNARLGFHALWSPHDQGNPSSNASITLALMELYPQPVQKWIRQHGGLTNDMMVLAGRELMTIVKQCPTPQ